MILPAQPELEACLVSELGECNAHMYSTAVPARFEWVFVDD
jgi:hypothetical protein